MIKKLLEKNVFFYIAIILLSAQVIFWFHGSNIISNADYSFFVSPHSDTVKLWYRWDSTRGLGVSQDRNTAAIIDSGLLSIIYFVTKNISTTEKILFFLWFCLSGVSFFHLAKHLLSKESNKTVLINAISFIGSLFYMMNPFLYNYRWGNAYLAAMYIYSIGPIILLIFMKIFETHNPKEKNKLFVLFCIANIFAIPSYQNPAYFLSFFSLLAITIFFYISDFFKNFWRYILYGLLYVAINLWWIVRPLAFFSSSTYAASVTLSFADMKSIEFKLTSFLNLLRLQGSWSTSDPQYFLFGSVYFNNPYIICASYLLTFIIFSFIFFKFKKMYLIWLSYLLALIFFVKGVHNPFPQIFQSLMTFSLLRIFRMAFEKFGNEIVLLFSFFLSLSLLKIYEADKKLGKIILSLAFVCILLNAYPFIIPNGIIPDNSLLQNKWLKRYTSIPDYYYEATEFISKIKIDTRNFILPENSNAPAGSWTVYKWSSVGGDPLWNLLQSSNYLMANDSGNSIGLTPMASPFLIAIHKYYENNTNMFFSNINKFLPFLNSNYIIFRRDNRNEEVYNNRVKRETIFLHLIQDTRIKLVKQWEDVYLFMIDQKYFIPHIYIPDKTVQVVGQLDDLIPKILENSQNSTMGLFLTKQNTNPVMALNDLNKKKIVIEYKKVNPTEYRLILHNVRGIVPIIFSESYDKEWNIYLTKNNNRSFAESDLSRYSVDKINQTTAANKRELSDLINANELSITKDKINSVEFISKKYSNTIQNNNISNGNIFELIFGKPIDKKTHVIANGYSNSWFINIDNLCEKNNILCKKNVAGNYDIELVIEYIPQYYLYFGLVISGTTLFACVGYLVFGFARKHKKG